MERDVPQQHMVYPWRMGRNWMVAYHPKPQIPKLKNVRNKAIRASALNMWGLFTLFINSAHHFLKKK
jgi:hypothetical protein